MSAKNYKNTTMLSRVTAKNVGDVFFLRHTVVQYTCTVQSGKRYRYEPLYDQFSTTISCSDQYNRNKLPMSQTFVENKTFHVLSCQHEAISHLPATRSKKLRNHTTKTSEPPMADTNVVFSAISRFYLLIVTFDRLNY